VGFKNVLSILCQYVGRVVRLISRMVGIVDNKKFPVGVLLCPKRRANPIMPNGIRQSNTYDDH